MSYRTILVNVETGHTAGKEVQLAADLARQYDAALIGLAAGFRRAAKHVLGGADPDFLDTECDEIQAELKAAETRFNIATKAAGLKSEWRTALEFPVLAVARAAVAADLVLVGRAPAGPVQIGRPWRFANVCRPAGSGRTDGLWRVECSRCPCRLERLPRGKARPF